MGAVPGTGRDLVRAARALIDVTPATGDRPLQNTARDLIRRDLESLRQASVRQLAENAGPAPLLAALHDRHRPGTTPRHLADAALQLAAAARVTESDPVRQLCQELVVSLSFYATVQDVFAARDHLVTCLKDQNYAIVDDLAAARYATRVNAGLAHRLLEQYRLRNAMGPGHAAG
jgi:hypothetical protein